MRHLTFLAALCLLFTPACGSKSDSKKTSANAPRTSGSKATVEEPKFSFNDTLSTSEDSRSRVLVREEELPNLMSLLPARIGRYKKIYEKSERHGPEVMLLYSAWGEYNTPDGAAIILHITDIGQSAEMQKTISTWAEKPMDIQNQYGRERSITFEGYPGFEKDYGKESSELAVLVAKRFIVNAACFNCSLDVLRDAIRAVPLKKLEAMK